MYIDFSASVTDYILELPNTSKHGRVEDRSIYTKLQPTDHTFARWAFDRTDVSLATARFCIVVRTGPAVYVNKDPMLGVGAIWFGKPHFDQYANVHGELVLPEDDFAFIWQMLSTFTELQMRIFMQIGEADLEMARDKWIWKTEQNHKRLDIQSARVNFGSPGFRWAGSVVVE